MAVGGVHDKLTVGPEKLWWLGSSIEIAVEKFGFALLLAVLSTKEEFTIVDEDPPDVINEPEEPLPPLNTQ
jgi:hypothetical protein